MHSRQRTGNHAACPAFACRDLVAFQVQGVDTAEKDALLITESDCRYRHNSIGEWRRRTCA